MKKCLLTSIIISIILVKPMTQPLCAASSAADISPLVSEFISIYDTLYDGDIWLNRFPSVRENGRVNVGGNDCYMMDYTTVLDYMKTVFTDDVAEDMLHRRSNGFVYANGKMHLIDGFVAVQTPKILFGDSEKLTSDAYSLSIDGDTATMKLTFSIPSNVFDENSEKPSTKMLRLHSAWSTETGASPAAL